MAKVILFFVWSFAAYNLGYWSARLLAMKCQAITLTDIQPACNMTEERQKLVEMLGQQGKAYAQTIWALRSLDPNSPYSVLHFEGFDGGGVVINAMAGKVRMTEVE